MEAPKRATSGTTLKLPELGPVGGARKIRLRAWPPSKGEGCAAARLRSRASRCCWRARAARTSSSSSRTRARGTTRARRARRAAATSRASTARPRTRRRGRSCRRRRARGSAARTRRARARGRGSTARPRTTRTSGRASRTAGQLTVQKLQPFGERELRDAVAHAHDVDVLRRRLRHLLHGTLPPSLSVASRPRQGARPCCGSDSTLDRPADRSQ